MEKLTSHEYRLEFCFHMIDCLLKGGMSHAHILEVLVLFYNYYSEDYTSKQLEDDILLHHETLLLSSGYKSQRNYQQEIENVVEFRGNGIITLADFYNDLKLSTAQEKSSCRAAINRIVGRGIIEKIDEGKTGAYRKITTNNASETKFLTSPPDEFNIKLPLDLNSMCKLYPKNIIIVSGSKGSGKTTFSLSTALANQNKMNVVYMNSEMGDEEFTDRMIKMGCNSPEDIKFKTYNKTSDYQDMVNGDRALYIVDFLEIHDKFYEIGKPIRAIHEKLKDGIAMINIQMRAGSTIGRGGDFSKEKSRLYLALDYDQKRQCTRFTIEDMKAPKNEAGYKGWVRNVKIINGSRLSPVDSWHMGEIINEKKTPFMERRF